MVRWQSAAAGGVPALVLAGAVSTRGDRVGIARVKGRNIMAAAGNAKVPTGVVTAGTERSAGHVFVAGNVPGRFPAAVSAGTGVVITVVPAASAGPGITAGS